jgi:hypothetical protein
MNKSKILLSIFGLLFLMAGIITISRFLGTKQIFKGKAAAATTVSISPSRLDIYPNQDFDFSVNMDTGENKVTGIDLIVGYEPSVFQITQVETGAGIANLNNTIKNNYDNVSGTVYFAVFTLDKSQAVSGSVQVMKIHGKVVGNPQMQNSLIVIDPSSAISGVGETQSVLLANSSGTTNLVSAPTPTPAPTAIPTNSPTPTPAPGNPNSCGGTCGSNNNCEANLFCFNGHCRNPSCSSSTNCNCPTITATPIPTKKPTSSTTFVSATKSPIATATPVKTFATSTPQPEVVSNFWENTNKNNIPTPISQLTIDPVTESTSSKISFLPWIIGSLLIAGIALILIVFWIQKQSHVGHPKPPIIRI